ncbi:hypothetical protein CC1G_10950 [Coprinopsis cinerea okayama7|uniref:Uncharacterized protein n=1 Tax=Coprinopsis cinerea (strain Okayama-7 / 130 / ATCC MYA-4618 / FGSC 9003) TaxID=240176 RepID=A8NT64_COPC7|nr:hypothetical protein CC1G_10950 [Coprinopsis cinerea okayama7\|eukprot:XP_001836169.1 hypothetical protein CC1G_10950 [Coprinopsis cinerea okayama7\
MTEADSRHYDPSRGTPSRQARNTRSATPRAGYPSAAATLNGLGGGSGREKPYSSQRDRLVTSRASDSNWQSSTDYGSFVDYGYGDAFTAGSASETQEYDHDDFNDHDEYDERREEGEEEWEWEDDIVKPTTTSSGAVASSGKIRHRKPQNSSSASKTRAVPRSPRGYGGIRSSRATPAGYRTPPAPVAHSSRFSSISRESKVDHHELQQPSYPARAILERREPPIPWGALPGHALSTLQATFFYALSILKPALKMMRYPLIAILFLWILAFTLTSVYGVFRSAFEPFCYIPGVNMMTACKWITYTPPKNVGNQVPTGKLQPPNVQWADYPSLVSLEAKTFDQLLDESIGGLGGSLSLNLKKTEVAVKDLITLVKASDLKAKDSLAEILGEFVDDAAVAVKGLSRLSAKFNGALDNIMAVNDYALRSVERARELEPRSLPEKLNALMPWSPPKKDVNLVVKETFSQAMDVLSTHMERLLLETEARYNELKKLEEKLDALHELVQRENTTIATDKEELLALLWTKLGGHRKQMRSFERHLKLLKELTTYRKQAYAHISAALHHLQAMNQEADDIRERVAAPDLMGTMVEPEVHMKSIQMGLERLKESRVRAKKLEEEAARRVFGLDWNNDRVEKIDSAKR